MSKLYKLSRYVYLQPKAFAQRGRLLAPEHYRELSGARNLSDALKALSTTVYGDVLRGAGDPREMEGKLYDHYSDFVEPLRASAPRPLRDLLGHYLLEMEVENIKLLAARLVRGLDLESVLPYLYLRAEEHLRRRDFIAELASAAEVSGFVGALVRHGVLSPEEGELVGGHLRAGDILPLAVLLDLKYYREFLRLVGRFRGGERRMLLEVVGPRIDAAVVKSVYRLKEWGAGELLGSFAVGRCFRIRYADIVGLGPEEVLKVAAAAYSCEAELESVERAAMAEGFRRANSAFLKGLLTSVPVVAVVELKRYEVANLVTILRGLSLGLVGKELEGLVIR